MYQAREKQKKESTEEAMALRPEVVVMVWTGMADMDVKRKYRGEPTVMVGVEMKGENEAEVKFLKCSL